MAKKNYDKRVKDRWKRKIEKEKLKRRAEFGGMYRHDSIHIVRRRYNG